jgi:hypothetical protein
MLELGTLTAWTAGAADTSPGVSTLGKKTRRPSSFVISGMTLTDGGKTRKEGKVHHSHFARL